MPGISVLLHSYYAIKVYKIFHLIYPITSVALLAEHPGPTGFHFHLKLGWNNP